MVINNLKYSAQLIAPNPKEIDYWIDLSEDPNGGIIKYFDGTKWDYLNKMDEQDNAIAEEIERAQAAEQQLQTNIDNVQDDVDSIQLTGSDGTYTLMVGDRNAGTIEVGDIDLSSYATKTELEAKMDKAGGEFTGAVGVPNLAIMTDGKGAMVYLQSSSTEFQVRTANAGIDSMTFTVQSSVPLKLTESGIMENGVYLENKYALLTDLDDFASKDVATTSSNGLMSNTDKKNLDNLVSNTAGYQTESQVDAKVASLVNQAPETLDTLDELAAALGDDPNFATTVANQIGTKADKTVASTSANGLMSSTDKQKLDSVEENANHYVLPTATASVLGGVKSSTTGTTSGKDYKVQINSDGTMKVNVPWTNTTYNAATTSANGLMSSTDKAKLDGIASNANNYTLPTASAGTKGGVKIGSGISVSSDGTISLTNKTAVVTELPASPDANTIYFVTGE